MKNSDILLVSDLHLENASKERKELILFSINLKISQMIEKNLSPVLVIAGDLDNGTNSYEFLKKINCEVVYVAGNHEFWDNDYYDTLHNLNHLNLKNVHFLHNNFVETNNYIFVGSTLWSNLGVSINPDILPYLKNTLNDISYITAKKWYTPSNTKKYSLIDDNNNIIKNKNWNILIEIEENKKSVDFINNFFLIIDFIKKNKNKYPITLEKISQYYKKDIQIGHSQFQKILKLNINKPIINVSHHSPFLEERLIYSNKNLLEFKPTLFNYVQEDIYNVKKGTDYSIPNYIQNISNRTGPKLPKDKNISLIFHYSNDGSSNFYPEVINNTSLWMHGHTHEMNYIQPLKNILIATNTAPLFNGLSLSNNKIVLDPLFCTDLNKFNISNEKFMDYFQKNSIKSIPVYNKEELQILSVTYLLSNFLSESYLNCINFLLYKNKKLFSQILTKDNEYISSKIESLNNLVYAINYNLSSLNNEQQDLLLAYSIRSDEKFSFNKKFNNIFNKKDILKYFSSQIIQPDKINEIPNNFTHLDKQSILQKCYFNSFYLNQSKLITEQTISLFSQFKNVEFQFIDIESSKQQLNSLDVFIKKNEPVSQAQSIIHNIQSKFLNTINKQLLKNKKPT